MKTVLHVGCGHKTLASEPIFRGWREVRFDVDTAVKPDIIGNMTDMSGLQDGAFNAIYTAHSLEHVYAHEVPLVISEFRRVLTADGFAVVIVPDLQAAAERIAKGGLHEVAYKSRGGDVTPFDMLYGHRKLVEKMPFMAHKGGFTAKSLTVALQKRFPGVAVTRDSGLNIRAIAFTKRVTREEVERLGVRVG